MRAFVQVGGRSLVASVYAVTPDGLAVHAPASPTGEAQIRLLGGPGRPPVRWVGPALSHPAGLLLSWPASPETQWTALAAHLGLEPTAPRPWSLPASPGPGTGPASSAEASASVELSASAETTASGSWAADPGASVESTSLPSPAAPAGPPVDGPPRATAEALMAARGARLEAPARLLMPVFHVQARALAGALQRSGADLSPMLEVEGAVGLRPRDALALRVQSGSVALFLEATVVTVRHSRARVRVTVPSVGVRTLLERSP